MKKFIMFIIGILTLVMFSGCVSVHKTNREVVRDGERTTTTEIGVKLGGPGVDPNRTVDNPVNRGYPVRTQYNGRREYPSRSGMNGGMPPFHTACQTRHYEFAVCPRLGVSTLAQRATGSVRGCNHGPGCSRADCLGE